VTKAVSLHPSAVSLVVARCAHLRPISTASYACMWPGASGSVALPRSAMSCAVGALSAAPCACARPPLCLPATPCRTRVCILSCHLISRYHMYPMPSLVVYPGLQRLGLCGCGSLGHSNEFDAGSVLGVGRFRRLWPITLPLARGYHAVSWVQQPKHWDPQLYQQALGSRMLGNM